MTNYKPIKIKKYNINNLGENRIYKKINAREMISLKRNKEIMKP